MSNVKFKVCLAFGSRFPQFRGLSGHSRTNGLVSATAADVPGALEKVSGVVYLKEQKRETTSALFEPDAAINFFES